MYATLPAAPITVLQGGHTISVIRLLVQRRWVHRASGGLVPDESHCVVLRESKVEGDETSELQGVTDEFRFQLSVVLGKGNNQAEFVRAQPPLQGRRMFVGGSSHVP